MNKMTCMRNILASQCEERRTIPCILLLVLLEYWIARGAHKEKACTLLYFCTCSSALPLFGSFNFFLPVMQRTDFAKAKLRLTLKKTLKSYG